MPKKSSENTEYWPAAFIASAQVFLGVAAGTFFTSNIDLTKLRVVVFNLVLSLILFFAGERIKNDRYK